MAELGGAREPVVGSSTGDIDPRFERMAGLCGLAAGILGLLYALGFVVLKNPTLYSFSLFIGALLGLAVIVALYRRLVAAGGPFALVGLLFAVLGAFGASIHGAFDLANALHPPPGGVGELPSGIDPRGVLTFGATGVGLLIFGWLILRSHALERWIGYLALALGVVLIAVYLGRLIVLDATSPFVLGPALVAGLASPILYLWVGYVLLTGRAAPR